mgnify:CR=1 FL=1
MPLGCSILKNCRANASCVNCYVTLSINLPFFHGHSQVTGSAQSPHPAPSVHTPAAYCTAASPVLPAVPGCCRTRLRWRCSRWQGSATLEPSFHPVGVHVIVAGKQFIHKETSMFFTFASSAVESSGLSVCRFMNPLCDAALCRSTPIHHTPDSYTKTRTCRGGAPPSCLRKTVRSLKSPTGAFIAPLCCANANNALFALHKILHRLA